LTQVRILVLGSDLWVAHHGVAHHHGVAVHRPPDHWVHDRLSWLLWLLLHHLLNLWLACLVVEVWESATLQLHFLLLSHHIVLSGGLLVPLLGVLMDEVREGTTLKLLLFKSLDLHLLAVLMMVGNGEVGEGTTLEFLLINSLDLHLLVVLMVVGNREVWEGTTLQLFLLNSLVVLIMMLLWLIADFWRRVVHISAMLLVFLAMGSYSVHP